MGKWLIDWRTQVARQIHADTVFSPDRKWVAYVDGGGVMVCKLPCTNPRQVTDYFVEAFGFTTDSRALWIHQIVTITRFEMPSWKRGPTFYRRCASWGMSMSIDGAHVASRVCKGPPGYMRGPYGVVVFDGVTGRERGPLKLPQDFGNMLFAPAGDTLMIPYSSGLGLFDSRSLKLRKHISGPIFFGGFSPDGKALLLLKKKDHLLLIDAATGNQRARLGPSNAWAFSPDGKTLAIAASELRTVDTATGGDKKRLRGANKAVKQLLVSRRGQAVAALSSRGVQTWQMPEANPAASFDAGGLIHKAAFSPDGRHLAALVKPKQSAPHLRIWSIKGALRHRFATAPTCGIKKRRYPIDLCEGWFAETTNAAPQAKLHGNKPSDSPRRGSP